MNCDQCKRHQSPVDLKTFKDSMSKEINSGTGRVPGELNCIYWSQNHHQHFSLDSNALNFWIEILFEERIGF